MKRHTTQDYIDLIDYKWLLTVDSNGTVFLKCNGVTIGNTYDDRLVIDRRILKEIGLKLVIASYK